RSLKRPVVVPDDLAGLVERLIVTRCVQALSLANKAGLVVAGYAKVEAQISTGKIAALLHAADASRDGAAKLDGRLRARAHLAAMAEATEETDETPQTLAQRQSGGAKIVTDLTIDELSLALGRQNVVHAAVINGGAAR